MSEPDYKAKYEHACRLLADLIPGGSGFHNDPDKCAEFIREIWYADRAINTRMLKTIGSSRLLKWLYNRALKRRIRKEEL